jgi:uncharacterized membrane protein
MPYLWTPEPISVLNLKSHQGETPLLRLEIWPHRSLPNTGFAATIWLMFAAGCLPLLSFIGTRVFWVLLACLLATLVGLWMGLRRSDRIHLREELLIWPDRMELTHYDLKGRQRQWQANPYWVHLALHATSGPVEQYLTLKDRGPNRDDVEARTVELAAFLSPQERTRLKTEISSVLSSLA